MGFHYREWRQTIVLLAVLCLVACGDKPPTEIEAFDGVIEDLSIAFFKQVPESATYYGAPEHLAPGAHGLLNSRSAQGDQARVDALEHHLQRLRSTDATGLIGFDSSNHMTRFSRFLALTCCLMSAAVNADQVPATGKLLVATDEVRGPYFAKTVVLLLHHDETGTLGVVVNRPIDASAIESLFVNEDLAAHRGSFYWGGPLSQSTVRALLRTDTPPEDAVRVFDAVYMVDMDEALLATAPSAVTLRFFAGYAGWAAGQLEHELAFDSWHIVPATEDLVFAEDADAIWRKLFLSHQYRAAVYGSERPASTNAFFKYR